MKIDKIFLVLVSFSLVTAAGFAEEKSDGTSKLTQPPLNANTARFDANKDGKLSREEAEAGRSAWREEQVNKLQSDLSGDGKFDETDRQILRDHLIRLSIEKSSPSDTNKDGKIDEDEKKAMADRERVRAEQWKTAADRNKNDILDASEEKAAMDAWQKEHKK